MDFRGKSLGWHVFRIEYILTLTEQVQLKALPLQNPVEGVATPSTDNLTLHMSSYKPGLQTV